MGHSHSRVNQQVLNNTLDENISKSITSNTQNQSVETLIESSKSCSSSVNQSNLCNISNDKISGNLNITGKIANKATVNFACINSDIAAQAMENSAVSSILGEINTLNGTEAAAVLNAKAAALSKSGSLGTSGNANSNINSTNENNVSNLTKSTVENIFKSNLSQKLTSKTVDECIGRTEQKNTVEAVGDEVGGNANVECTMSNTLEQVQECKQLSEAIQSAYSKTAQELGFKLVSENITANKTEMTSEAISETIATGPIQDIGNAISGVIGDISGLFGLASLGAGAPFIVICCIVCCVILLSCVSSLVMSKSSGSSTTNSNSNFTGTNQTTNQATNPIANSGNNALETNPDTYSNLSGGYSQTTSSDFNYIASFGLNILSDVFSDSSPLF